MRIGLDIDGVLADFNAGFIQRCKEVTGEDKFPPNYIPHTWNYPQALGYSEAQVSAVWENIKRDPMFWAKLPAYAHTDDFLHALCDQTWNEHDVYFVTSRLGLRSKLQTEDWLDAHFYPFATVLISSKKGASALALDLEIYIDDKTENCEDVKQFSNADVFMLARPWNENRPGIIRCEFSFFAAELFGRLA